MPSHRDQNHLHVTPPLRRAPCAYQQGTVAAVSLPRQFLRGISVRVLRTCRQRAKNQESIYRGRRERRIHEVVFGAVQLVS